MMDSESSYNIESESFESIEDDDMVEDRPTIHPRPRLWITIHDTEHYVHPHTLQHFSERFGPRNRLNVNAQPIDYFNQLTCTADGSNLIDILVEETNRYANQSIEQDTITTHSRSSKWIETNASEMSAFIGLLLSMGLVKKPSIEAYWNTSTKTRLFHTPNFSSVFTRNRFQLLLKYLHCNDNNTAVPRGRLDHDPAHKIRPVLDLVNASFKDAYSLARDITIDESIVGFKGRNRIVQYVPAKKSHRWGPKLFVVAESETGYTYHLKLYAGKNHTAGRTHPNGLGYEVVCELMAPLLGKYHHLIVDNFFSSPILCQYLFDNNTYMTSTVRPNRKGMPKSFLNMRVPKGEMRVMQSGSLMVMKYGDRKEVSMLSTFCTPKKEEHENARGIMRELPNVIHIYNRFMGGVDLADAQTQTYDPDIRSVKMWKKILINILLRIVVNSYILYKQTRGLRPKISRLEFTMTLCEQLVGEVQTRRETTNIQLQYHPLERLTGRHFPDYIPNGKRRVCKVCHKKSRFLCVECEVGLCVGRCYRRYHSILQYEE